MNIFGERLKQAREERGMTLNQLAADAEMSRSQVFYYETGKKSPKVDCLVRLAKALDCPTDFLCGLEN